MKAHDLNISSFDPCIPLVQGTYYHQPTGNETWIEASASELTELLHGSQPPAFRTILSYDNDMYAGPLYFDFDGDLEEVLHCANAFAVKLEGSMPFPVEIDSTNMTVAPVVAGDGRQQRVLG